MGREEDVRRRASIGNVDVVVRKGEGACKLTVAASAIRSTRESVGRATEKAAAHGVSPLLERSIVLTGGRVPVPETC